MAEQLNDVELSNKGQKVQAITSAATAAIGALLGAGVIGAGISNPIALGITIFSALLPSLFHKKKPAPAPALEGVRGLADIPADQVGGGGLAALAAVVTQLAAIATSLALFLHQVPTFLPFIPADWQPWIMLTAAAIAGFVPGLQKLGELLKGGGQS